MGTLRLIHPRRNDLSSLPSYDLAYRVVFASNKECPVIAAVQQHMDRLGANGLAEVSSLAFIGSTRPVFFAIRDAIQREILAGGQTIWIAAIVAASCATLQSHFGRQVIHISGPRISLASHHQEVSDSTVLLPTIVRPSQCLDLMADDVLTGGTAGNVSKIQRMLAFLIEGLPTEFVSPKVLEALAPLSVTC